jgi:hypothetical protein
LPSYINTPRMVYVVQGIMPQNVAVSEL